MRHNVKGRKFGRDSSHKMAMMNNLAKSLIEHEQIRTTLPKAKDLRSYVERLITVGAKNTLHARRQLIAKLGTGVATDKLMTTLSERFAKRPGGYTRVLKAGFRQGDNAPMAVIELVDREASTSGQSKIKEGQEAVEGQSKG
ncbi:MAG: 50S ribosomal protein L17 [Rickettsiales bacterium]|nr:50S ribosomal protein L17 [Rickettsiales bacterium]|tara:strand:- start:3809 stop:4234 length:426 start_codon:yes stop_codon:yes gene_type:complete